MDSWVKALTPLISTKESKSILHNFLYMETLDLLLIHIFTKSVIIERDLELHKEYSDNCFMVWSITTNNETLKRIIEPGTPSSKSVFKAMEKFSNSGIKCVVNIDPILPLITDSKEELSNILNTTNNIGVDYINGAILRIRYNIWERIKYLLQILNMNNFTKEYEKIFNFKDPLDPKKKSYC